MIRTRHDAHVAMIQHINYAIDATSPERAIADATIANTLCSMLDHLPQGTPATIGDVIQ